jgi:hypothetical protein
MSKPIQASSVKEAMFEIDKQIAYYNSKIQENLQGMSEILNRFLPKNAQILADALNAFQADAANEETEVHIKELQYKTLNSFLTISKVCGGIIEMQQSITTLAVNRRQILNSEKQSERGVYPSIKIISLNSFASPQDAGKKAIAIKDGEGKTVRYAEFT